MLCCACNILTVCLHRYSSNNVFFCSIFIFGVQLADGEVPEVVDDQPLNPFTELQVLASHSDIVRCLARIDHSR